MFCRMFDVTNSSTTSFVCFGFVEYDDAGSILVRMAEFLKVPNIDLEEPWLLADAVRDRSDDAWPALAIDYFGESDVLVVSVRDSIEELNCVTVLDPRAFRDQPIETWTDQLRSCAGDIGYEPDQIGIVIGADVST